MTPEPQTVDWLDNARSSYSRRLGIHIDVGALSAREGLPGYHLDITAVKVVLDQRSFLNMHKVYSVCLHVVFEVIERHGKLLCIGICGDVVYDNAAGKTFLFHLLLIFSLFLERLLNEDI